MAGILIVDDDKVICKYLMSLFNKHGYEAEYVMNASDAISIHQQKKFELVFCDLNLPDRNGRVILKKIIRSYPETQVIIISSNKEINTAIEMVKAGAYTFIAKAFSGEVILSETKKALKHRQTKLKNRDTYQSNKNTLNISPITSSKISNITELPSQFIFGKSDRSSQIMNQIRLVAPTNYSIVIYGESGTGKEAAALAIHSLSKRNHKPFIAVDCGILTPELARSELFGHEKGAFTGATDQKKGFFELADGGTLFLDEVANLSYDIQASLLRAIQERKIRRLGSQTEKKIDVRIIIATNISLSEAVKNKLFRDDLYHRINEFSIELLPIREQVDDIILYASHFLNQINLENKKQIPGFDDDVVDIFQKYDWPGNLRELNNTIKRASIFSDNQPISKNWLPKEILKRYKQLTSDDKQFSYSSHSEKDDLRNTAMEAEQNKIISVMAEVNYNKSEAAKILNIDRKTLYNKLKKYKLTF